MKNEGVNDMKTKIKAIGYGLWVMVALLVSAPAVAQSVSQQEPNAIQFQSTSVLQTSGSTYSSTPTLNEDGTVPSPSGPRRAPKPINDDSDWEDRKDDIGGGISTPVGDAVLPLCLFALAYVGIVALRRRRALKR